MPTTWPFTNVAGAYLHASTLSTCIAFHAVLCLLCSVACRNVEGGKRRLEGSVYLGWGGNRTKLWGPRSQPCEHLQVADHTPAITPALWKQLLRWLNTPFVEGNQYLIAAIANLGPEGNQPCGLILGGYENVIQFLSTIVGAAAASSSG